MPIEATPIPAEDTEGTTANLKALRAIYRAAYAKIEAARVANLKQLTDPLTLRLKQLEADLTKKDRVPDAKTVREYREKLSEGSAVVPSGAAQLDRTSTNGSAAAKSNEAGKSARAPLKKFPTGDDRKAAEWVLSVGGIIRIQGSDQMILDVTELPRGKFEITGVYLEFTSTNRPKGPIDNFLPLAGLKGLTRLNVRNVPMTDAHWEILPSLPSLQAFMAERTGVTDAVFAVLAATQIKILDLNYETSVTGEGMEALRAAKSLERLQIYNFLPSEEGLRQLGKLDTLISLALSGAGSKLRDEHLPLLAGLKKLEFLLVRRTALTAEALASMKQWSGLTTLGFDMKPGTTADQVAKLAKAFPKLEVFSIEGEESWSYAAEDVSALAGFPKLKTFSSTTSKIGDAAMSGVLALSKLENLRFSNCVRITDVALETFAGHKSLKSLFFESMPNITDAGLAHLTGLRSLTKLELKSCPKLTDTAIAAFKKERPDVTVTK